MVNFAEPTARQWIEDFLRQHDGRLAERGNQCLERVGDWSFDDASRSVVCRVGGSHGARYTVRLRLPTFGPVGSDHLPEGYDAICNCPYSENGQFLCKHTYAAAKRLGELWDVDPTIRIRRLLSRGASRRVS